MSNYLHRMRRVVTIAAVYVLILTQVVGAPTAQAGTSYASRLHDSSVPLSGPWGLATDELGNVYVADKENHRIVKFGPDLEPIVSFGMGPPKFADGTAEEGALWFPQAVAYGNGFVYVADTANNRVQKFTTGGSYAGGWGKDGSANGDLSEPTGIAVNPCDGNVYVTEGRNIRVSVFGPNGNFLFKFGSSGTGDNQFTKPEGISFSPNVGCYAYVTDSYGGRVMVFSSSGSQVATFGTQGKAEGQLSFPDEIAVERDRPGIEGDGNVWVVETGEPYRVSKWAPTSEGGTSYVYRSEFHSGEEHLSSPHGIALDEQGNLFVSNTGESDVYKYKDVAPKLEVEKVGSRSNTLDTEGFRFSLKYNQVDKTCKILGKLTVTIPGKTNHVFQVEDDVDVGDTHALHKFDISSKQTNWLEQAWDGGNKATIVGKFSGPCTDGVKITKNGKWNA